jgi:hypothetical protein
MSSSQCFRKSVLAVFAAVAFSGVAWAQCDNPALSGGGNSSFSIELKGGAPSYDGDFVTFTYEVCQEGGQNALSHWILAPVIDCYGSDDDGTAYTLGDLLVGATLQTWDEETAQWIGTDITVVIGEDPTTGLDGIKFDDLDPTDDCHRYTLTFDISKLEGGYTLCAGCIGAATKAGNEDIRSKGKNAKSPGFTSVLGPVCCPMMECMEETAYGGDSAGGGPGGWWFYFDTAAEEIQMITAGQTIEVGEVMISSNGDGTSTITILLSDGVELQNVSEPVKIQGYDVLPSRRPAAGLFTTYKGAELVVTVPDAQYYVIHLDVLLCP